MATSPTTSPSDDRIIHDEHQIRSHYKISITENTTTHDAVLAFVAWKSPVVIVSIPGEKRPAYHAVFNKLKLLGERWARKRRFPNGPPRRLSYHQFLDDDWRGVLVLSSSSTSDAPSVDSSGSSDD
jgi:hypothetical protein